MPQGLWNLEWLNQNSQRSYPLAESSIGTDITNSFTLPRSFLLELDLPIHTGLDVDPWRFYVKSINVFASGFLLLIGYQPASGDPVNVATATIPSLSHIPNTPYALGGIGDYADTVGKVIIGRLDEINAQPSGSFNFTAPNAAIDPDCVRPILRGVSSIIVSAGAETSEPMYGDIVLVAQQNIQLTPVIVDGQDPQILISAIQGEGLVEDCICDGNQAGQPILRINGIPPTAGGEFSILGNACLQPQAIENGIQLVDTCSQPCCGCAELEAITQDLERFGSQETTLQNFLTQLASQVTTMSDVVLGSKLNDQGCVQCG